MAIRYRIDVLSKLKAAGYNTTKIRKEALIPERVMTQFRRGILPSWTMIDTLCKLLQCQPGDLVEYIPDETGH